MICIDLMILMDSCRVGESGQIGERSSHRWFVLKYLLGYPRDRMDRRAPMNFDKPAAGWPVKSIHLAVAAKAPGAEPGKSQTAANAAEKGCPISRLLKADITMTAKLA